MSDWNSEQGYGEKVQRQWQTELATLRAQLAAKDAEIAKVAKERDEERHKKDTQRTRVQEAHAEFHRWANTKPSGDIGTYHGPDAEFDPAEQMRIIVRWYESALSAAREALRTIRKIGCMNEGKPEFWCRKDGSAHSVYCPAGIAEAVLPAPAVQPEAASAAEKCQRCWGDGYPECRCHADDEDVPTPPPSPAPKYCAVSYKTLERWESWLQRGEDGWVESEIGAMLLNRGE